MRKRMLKTLHINLDVACWLLVGFVSCFPQYVPRPVDMTRTLDLSDYRPFIEGTLAVFPDDEPTLKLSDPLPRLDGATALYPVYSAFVQALYPEDTYSLQTYWNDSISTVLCTNTPKAYKRLMERKTDVIFVAAPSKVQMEEAERLGVKMKLTPIGREAFVFFVNAENPISAISSDDLRKVYSGEITNWKELGGQDLEIQAFQRNPNSGSQTAMESFMGDTPLIKAPLEREADAMGGIIDVVSNYYNHPFAIGYSFLFYVTRMENADLKLIALDGVTPSRATVNDGSYPLSSEFYAVTLDDNNNPHIQELLDWILSPQGQKLIEKTGYTPL